MAWAAGRLVRSSRATSSSFEAPPRTGSGGGAAGAAGVVGEDPRHGTGREPSDDVLPMSRSDDLLSQA
ncbi:hypothetical protein [Nesterenkonia pannonica]|uniref:hypothetical protein n=1 Tax=Nesterenkonia pannonica TaxID=1548602 RepID=UPI0021640823|nr:hypothetical protein [Nesterenkonia pannonica]